jgi:hypothetical protein
MSVKASNPSDVTTSVSAAQADVLECKRSGRLRQNMQEAEADVTSLMTKEIKTQVASQVRSAGKA